MQPRRSLKRVQVSDGLSNVRAPTPSRGGVFSNGPAPSVRRDAAAWPNGHYAKPIYLKPKPSALESKYAEPTVVLV